MTPFWCTSNPRMGFFFTHSQPQRRPLCRLMSTKVYWCLLMSTIPHVWCRIFAYCFSKQNKNLQKNRKRLCINQQKTSFRIRSGFVRDLLGHRSSFVRPSFVLRSSFVHPSFILRSSFVHPSFDLRSTFVRASFAKPEVTKDERRWLGRQPSSERGHSPPRVSKDTSKTNLTCCLFPISLCSLLSQESCRINKRIPWRT